CGSRRRQGKPAPAHGKAREEVRAPRWSIQEALRLNRAPSNDGLQSPEGSPGWLPGAASWHSNPDRDRRHSRHGIDAFQLPVAGYQLAGGGAHLAVVPLLAGESPPAVTHGYRPAAHGAIRLDNRRYGPRRGDYFHFIAILKPQF